MADDNDWSEGELAATVAAYLQMLRLEKAETPYSKTDFRRQLLGGPLSTRTESSVEFRMQNISAVMESLGQGRIAGYRPAKNVGPTNEARLRALIVEAGGAAEFAPAHSTSLKDVVSDSSQLMGVKAVFGALSSHVLCFGGRGEPNDKAYFSVAESAARRAVTQPFVIAIGGGKNVRDGLEGKVLNVARLSLVYGPTSSIVADPVEVQRLAQWPVAIALHDVWRFVGNPHLVDDLGFDDRTILAGAQDGVIRPDEKVDRLWAALQEWPVERAALPLPANFYDTGLPYRVGTKLPKIPASGGAEEGERVWKLQLKPSVVQGWQEARRLSTIRSTES
jgi:5-methylcytosine-specific restriction protein A